MFSFIVPVVIYRQLYCTYLSDCHILGLIHDDLDHLAEDGTFIFYLIYLNILK